jgi:hypothetical protein
MGAWAIVLLILAMKVPIFGLIWLVWWAGRAPAAAGPGDEARIEPNPRRPEPRRPLRPRRRGPHGGAALPAPGQTSRRTCAGAPRALPASAGSLRAPGPAPGRTD